MFSLINESFRKMEARNKLKRAFKLSKIYRSHKYDGKDCYVYPKIHEVTHKLNYVRFTFTLPDGVNPDLIQENRYIFEQVFGINLVIKGDLKKFTLKVYNKGLPDNVTYKYDDWKPLMDNHVLPIVCGMDISNQPILFDFDKNPHMLVSGTTGSGKSSMLRVILTSLMLNKKPEEVQFILGDLKRSEFGIFRNVAHVQGVHVDADSLYKALKSVKREMSKRGNLLDQNGVPHISMLKEKLPYIIVAIDEVALLKKEKEIMSIIEDISSVGRSLGVLLILSMQRPDYKLLDGKLKNNLNVRISGRQSNARNAEVAGVPKAENIKISERGRMIVVLDDELLVQCPHLEFDEAKELLSQLKVEQSMVQGELSLGLVHNEPNICQVQDEPNNPKCSMSNDIPFNLINEEDLQL